MAIVLAVRRRRRQLLGPDSAGVPLTPKEFDRADFQDGWRYELINGVLIVSPPPLLNERDPNEYLGHLLLIYQEYHPEGHSLDFTAPERLIKTKRNRRRADRAIWCGLGHLPTEKDVPSILVEFVSAGKREVRRDYEEKREEYAAIGVEQYWVVDRFAEMITVYTFSGGKTRTQLFKEKQVLTSPLLPGFELPVSVLLARALRWPEKKHEAD